MVKQVLIGGGVALLGMVVGGYSGMTYAGNFAPNFEFLGLRGYEAGGSLGALAGLVVGGLVGVLCIPRWLRK
jgi:hypothetical protein